MEENTEKWYSIENREAQIRLTRLRIGMEAKYPIEESNRGEISYRGIDRTLCE